MKHEEFEYEYVGGEPVYTGTHSSGYKVMIRQDSCPYEPELIGTLAHTHMRSNFHSTSRRMSHEDLEDLEKHDSIIFVPVYIHEHSGVTISASSGVVTCSFDSGRLGSFYVTKNDPDLEGMTEEEIKERLVSDVNVLNQYVNGDIWDIDIIDPITNEVVESCGETYGLECAMEFVDEMIPKEEFNLCVVDVPMVASKALEPVPCKESRYYITYSKA